MSDGDGPLYNNYHQLPEAGRIKQTTCSSSPLNQELEFNEYF